MPVTPCVGSILCHCCLISIPCAQPCGPPVVALASVAVFSLQDLGVTKVGHMKRILCGIKELSRSPPAAEA